MNINKTKIMSNVKMNEEVLKLSSSKGGIVKVEEYVYLGQTISMDGKLEKELKSRKAKAWRKFWG